MSETSLSQRLVRGDKAALARLISWAENGDARFAATLRELGPRTSKCWRTGITGPPGAGKSTLVNELAKELRKLARTVGILAVDPSSPFSGGALLGDRIRMEERTTDAGVFIRSMASRGAHGGIARAAVDACDAIEAAGYAEVLLETVGVGQAEYDVVGAADTVLVVLCPGAGDGIQAMKAGILEVADVLAVNKADREGARRAVRDLEYAIAMSDDGQDAVGWKRPVVSTVAVRGEGIDDLVAALDAHRQWLDGSGARAVRRRARAVAEIEAIALDQVRSRIGDVRGAGALPGLADRVVAGDLDPYRAADVLLETALPAETS